MMQTQVGIVGAGPAGLMLAHLPRREGIASVVLEARDRAYVESRVRAGVLEQTSVDLLSELGLTDLLHRYGLIHRGIALRFAGRSHRIDFVDLTGGQVVTVYGQQEVVKDLIAALLDAGGQIHFEVADVTVHDLTQERPTIRFRHSDGAARELSCDFIAGCDGFHGICRPSIPAGVLSIYERAYPLAWLGILTASPPISEELIYTHHPRGFALCSMRSPQVSRLYVQVAPDEDLATWPDERVWAELHARLEGVEAAPPLIEGPVLQKGITPMRSFVAEPMQYGRLFLAGDAAHIVPPTGAKGMNLAFADVRVLARALAAYYATGRDDLLERYSETCLRRVWKVQRFSWWMTALLHRFAEQSAYEQRVQLAELDYVTSSRAASQSLAENYVGLPLE